MVRFGGDSPVDVVRRDAVCSSDATADRTVDITSWWCDQGVGDDHRTAQPGVSTVARTHAGGHVLIGHRVVHTVDHGLHQNHRRHTPKVDGFFLDEEGIERGTGGHFLPCG